MNIKPIIERMNALRLEIEGLMGHVSAYVAHKNMMLDPEHVKTSAHHICDKLAELVMLQKVHKFYLSSDSEQLL